MQKIFRSVMWCALVMGAAGSVFGTPAALAQSSVDQFQVPLEYIKNMKSRPASSAVMSHAGSTKRGPSTFARTASVPGIDSLANWTGQFTAPGFDPNDNPQSTWSFAMVGGAPEAGGTTTINAPIIPVTVRLLDQNGHVARTKNGTRLILRSSGPLASAVVNSPIFQPFSYTSGVGQYNDQMQRAEFWDRIHHGEDGGGSNWHTVLSPDVKTGRTMDIPFGSYFYGLHADGSIAYFLVEGTAFTNVLFPPTFPVDNTTVIGAAELAGDMTTHDLTTLLFNNVYLYDKTPDQCCVLGFHEYDFEPGVPSNGNLPRLYVMNYSSWVSPGLFVNGSADVTTLSHEVSETFNDPFVNNVVPWWSSVDPFSGFAQCQDVLEVGDVVEVLTALPLYQVAMNGRTYHVQNEAMFPWFADESPSPAHLAAYSFPDEDTLLSLSPGPLHPGCKP